MWWPKRTPQAHPVRDTASDGVPDAERTTPIAQVQARSYVSVSGFLTSMTFSAPGAQPQLLATIDDGTGAMQLRWLGRSSIPGLHVGDFVEVEGMAGFASSQCLTMMNPLYRIIAKDDA